MNVYINDLCETCIENWKIILKGIDLEGEHWQLPHYLASNKAHFCPEWDYLLIDQHMPEFDICTCELKRC